MAFKRQTRCIDCNEQGIETDRPARKPGPRCEEHHREKLRRQRKANHSNRIEEGYGITSDQYWDIYKAQGGHCFICEKATGKTKHLAVDHDHTKGCGHDPKMGCPNCVRALLCGRCNKLVAFLDEHALARAIIVLKNPPAQRILNEGESKDSTVVFVSNIDAKDSCVKALTQAKIDNEVL